LVRFKTIIVEIACGERRMRHGGHVARIVVRRCAGGVRAAKRVTEFHFAIRRPILDMVASLSATGRKHAA